jgi:hypothetical protein
MPERIHREPNSYNPYSVPEPSDQRTQHRSDSSRNVPTASPQLTGLPQLERPRVRPYHDDSSGESDSGSPTIGYRALRPDEPNPFDHGLMPPEPNDPSVGYRKHVAQGSKLAVKSDIVSGTRSKNVASAWAADTDETGRVAMYQHPPGSVDLTRQTGRDQVFTTAAAKRSPAVKFAKGSQEVLHKGGVPAEHILGVYNTQRVTEEQYEQARQNPPAEYYAQSRSRSKAGGQPTPVVLTHADKRNVGYPASRSDQIASGEPPRGYVPPEIAREKRKG